MQRFSMDGWKLTSEIAGAVYILMQTRGETKAYTFSIVLVSWLERGLELVREYTLSAESFSIYTGLNAFFHRLQHLFTLSDWYDL